MRILTPLALLLAARATADAPAPDARTAVAVRLERLTDADAYRLDGRRTLFLVELDCVVALDKGPYSVCDCKAPHGTWATVWLRMGRAGETMVVEATLRVIRHPAQVIRGRFVPARTGYRLLDAVRRD